MSSLTDLRSDVTERLILDAALQSLLATGEITARGAARQAGISERTVFRYFASRDEFLDAVAAATIRKVQIPPPPATMDDLRRMPRALYTAFEEHRQLIKASWESELRGRIIATAAKQRWIAIRKVVDAHAPNAPETRRKLAAANIRYYLSASTWHYYRFTFRFTVEETIAAAEAVIENTLASLSQAAAKVTDQQGAARTARAVRSKTAG